VFTYRLGRRILIPPEKRASSERSIAGGNRLPGTYSHDAKLDYFLIADYALRDSIPSRPSPIGAERCEHCQIRLRSYAGSDCKLAVPA
jgi:hypothetical protein